MLKILKRTKKRSRFLKKEILIVFIHLEAIFFPDTLFWLNYFSNCLPQAHGSSCQVFKTSYCVLEI
ncbi:hypothetical protein CEE88_07510 [Lactobacillus crispatus]|nr:hypothetical protein CEE88_07510 [Lactobacillus crispatus]